MWGRGGSDAWVRFLQPFWDFLFSHPLGWVSRDYGLITFQSPEASNQPRTGHKFVLYRAQPPAQGKSRKPQPSTPYRSVPALSLTYGIRQEFRKCPHTNWGTKSPSAKIQRTAQLDGTELNNLDKAIHMREWADVHGVQPHPPSKLSLPSSNIYFIQAYPSL